MFGMMADRLRRLSGIEPFVVDQTVTVAPAGHRSSGSELLELHGPALEAMGGAAGFLVEDYPVELVPGCDAVLLSLHDAME